MKIKLLDRSDIRRFGGTVVDVADHIATELLSRKMAVRVDLQKISEKKRFVFPPNNKAMWTPPEEKAMAGAKSAIIAHTVRNPKVDENLFPKSIIS